MIAIFKTVTCIYHYCNMSEARRPFVVNKCMYVCTCVNWNGIISPILFCIYIDDLLSGLANLGVGCYIDILTVYVLIQNSNYVQLFEILSIKSTLCWIEWVVGDNSLRDEEVLKFLS